MAILPYGIRMGLEKGYGESQEERRTFLRGPTRFFRCEEGYRNRYKAQY